MYSKVVSLTLLAALVHAQGTTTGSAASPSVSIDACTLTCLQSATGCDSYTDLSCVCTSTEFQQSVAQCLQSSCPATDLTAALALQSLECTSISSTGSGSSTTPTSATSGKSSSHTSTSTSTSSSGSASGAAAGMMLGNNGLFTAVGAVLVGVIGGGLLVL